MRRFDTYNPMALTLYFSAVTAPVMLGMDPVLIGCSCCGAILLYVSLYGLREWKMHAYMLGLFALMSAINPLMSHKGATVLFVINDNPVTMEALCYGMAASGMIVTVVYWFRIYSAMMTSDKLQYVFGGISPKLALLLSMTLRYVPLFTQQTKRVSQAQKALGLYKEDNIIDGIRGGMRVFSVMVTWTLENGIITADSMATRGYGTGRRSRFAIYTWKTADVMLILLSTILLAASLAGKRAIAYYPLIAFEKMSAVSAFGYIAYAILAVMPSAIQWKEVLRWRLLRSRM